jgi:endonuclease/exonuclease/phosphatase family metal-dependent hydrolase
LAWLATACNPFDPLDTGFDAIEDAVLYEAGEKSAAPTDVASLRVVTYNIKFGGGRIRFFFECDGERSLMSEQEVGAHLAAIARLVRFTNADILLLQEIDVESKRSAYVDQVQWLLDRTDLNYGAYASQWKADFVPSDGIGRIDSGNAILSRWPFAEAQRLALPLIGDQDGLTRYFYLRRNILRTQVALPGADDFYALNVHTSAFAEDDTKLEQLALLQEVLGEVSASAGRFVVGGDLNSLPPRSRRVAGFPDDDCTDGRFDPDDYSGEESWLEPLYDNYQAAIPLADYQATNEPYFTFSGDETVGWTRKLDYLFTNDQFEANSGLVYQTTDHGGFETLPLSDHAPLGATVVLR